MPDSDDEWALPGNAALVSVDRPPRAVSHCELHLSKMREKRARMELAQLKHQKQTIDESDSRGQMLDVAYSSMSCRNQLAKSFDMRPDKITTLKVRTAAAFDATVHQSLCGMSSFFARRSPLVFGSLAYDETKEKLTTEIDDAEHGVSSTHLSVFCCNQRCQCFFGELLSERDFPAHT